MKKIIFFTVFLMASISYAGSSEYIERNTMRDICENIECLDDVVEGYNNFYGVKPTRVMAVNVTRIPDRKKLVMQFWSFDHGTPGGKYASYDKVYYNKNIAKIRALKSCDNRERLTMFKMKAFYSLAQVKGGSKLGYLRTLARKV